MKKIIIIFWIFFILWWIISSFFIIKQDGNLENIIDKYKKSSVSIELKNNIILYKDDISESLSIWEEIEKINSISKWFFIRSDWIILTNKHAISLDKSKIIIKTYTWETYEAHIIYLDKNTDLALIKINTNRSFPILDFVQNIWDINIWDSVMSIWKYIYYWKITWKDKTLDELKLTNLLETDLSLVRWDSGSALINDSWKVIAINTAISNYKKNVSFSIILDEKIIKIMLEKIKKS